MKYVIYRLPDSREKGSKEKEIIGVEFASDIHEATKDLVKTIKEDLFEYKEWVTVYGPDSIGNRGRIGGMKYGMRAMITSQKTGLNYVVNYIIYETYLPT